MTPIVTIIIKHAISVIRSTSNKFLISDILINERSGILKRFRLIKTEMARVIASAIISSINLTCCTRYKNIEIPDAVSRLYEDSGD